MKLKRFYMFFNRLIALTVLFVLLTLLQRPLGWASASSSVESELTGLETMSGQADESNRIAPAALVTSFKEVWPSSPASVPISFGQTVSGAISTPGQVDTYTFSGANGDNIRVRIVKTSGNLNLSDFTVYRPDGTSVCSTIFLDNICILDATGTYTILIGGSGTGEYEVSLECLSGSCGGPPIPSADLVLSRTDTPDPAGGVAQAMKTPNLVGGKYSQCWAHVREKQGRSIPSRTCDRKPVGGMLGRCWRVFRDCWELLDQSWICYLLAQAGSQVCWTRL